jgi:[acyl-carrier-protein] S-malonyltransferase
VKKIGFIFPGQGSQYVGMGKDFLTNYPIAQELFLQASEILKVDMANLCLNGPESALKLTANTQPAIYLISIIAYRILEQEGIHPAIAAGHSLGEYSALAAANAISFADGLRLVRKRGELMQEAVPVGKGLMAAIMGLDTKVVEEACVEVQNQGKVVQIANYNCPGQVVISGEKTAVEETMAYTKKLGAKKTTVLPVSAPFHSPLMKPAEQALATELEKISFRDPSFPIIANVKGEAVNTGEAVKEILKNQITSPVKWEDSMHYLLGQEIDTVVEVGPGQVLLGLMKRINKNTKGFGVENTDTLNKLLKAIKI